MKLEEVLPAFRAGKKIRCTVGNGEPLFENWHHLLEETSAEMLQSDNWSIVDEPATDDELAAAFEARAEHYASSNSRRTAVALRRVADMVRKRYVDQSWKVGK